MLMRMGCMTAFVVFSGGVFADSSGETLYPLSVGTYAAANIADFWSSHGKR